MHRSQIGKQISIHCKASHKHTSDLWEIAPDGCLRCITSLCICINSSSVGTTAYPREAPYLTSDAPYVGTIPLFPFARQGLTAVPVWQDVLEAQELSQELSLQANSHGYTLLVILKTDLDVEPTEVIVTLNASRQCDFEDLHSAATFLSGALRVTAAPPPAGGGGCVGMF